MTGPSPRPSHPLAVRRLTVRYGRAVALSDVSLAVPRGAFYVLLGRKGAGKTSLVRCLLGERTPSGGEALLFGTGGWWKRRKALARVGVVRAEESVPAARTAEDLLASSARRTASWDRGSVAERLLRFGVPAGVPLGRLPAEQKEIIRLALALGTRPEALVLDDLLSGLEPAGRRALLEELAVEAAERHTAVLLAAGDAAGVDEFATHVGILKEGRLVVDAGMESLKHRFRRIRYANEVDDERTEYGTELDAFDAVRVKVRGWGVEAVVSNFDDAAFAALAALSGVVDARAEALSVEEIFAAVTDEAPPAVAPDPGP